MFVEAVIHSLNTLIKNSLEKKNATGIDINLEIGGRKGNIRTQLDFDIGTGSGSFLLAFAPRDLKLKMRLEGDFPLKEDPKSFYHLELAFIIPLAGIDTEDMINRKLAFAIQAVQSVLQ